MPQIFRISFCYSIDWIFGHPERVKLGTWKRDARQLGLSSRMKQDRWDRIFFLLWRQLLVTTETGVWPSALPRESGKFFPLGGCQPAVEIALNGDFFEVRHQMI
jgi:hypothetical protein